MDPRKFCGGIPVGIPGEIHEEFLEIYGGTRGVTCRDISKVNFGRIFGAIHKVYLEENPRKKMITFRGGFLRNSSINCKEKILNITGRMSAKILKQILLKYLVLDFGKIIF